MSKTLRVLAVLLTAGLFAACGGDESVSGRHPVLGDYEEAFLDDGGVLTCDVPASITKYIEALAAEDEMRVKPLSLTVDYPLEGSMFPPEFVAPTFLWHDDDEAVDTWLVSIGFPESDAKPIRVLVPGSTPPKGEVDLEAFAATNSAYEGTDYQNSAKAWKPSRALWEEIKRRSVGTPATVSFDGLSSKKDRLATYTTGSTTITTSEDPVGAPFFYRDVPLMAAVGKEGRIAPLGAKAIPLIAWRLRDVSRPESKLVLKGMASCGNCHSFSLDGKTLGMDVDGPDGDKGMYAIKPVERNMVIGSGDVITWNSFPDKPKDHRTIGFMSRVSPDGRYVASTLNEALFITNFKDYKFLQVFYPTRGIIGYHSVEDKVIRALPGADDTEFVHCSPAWSPDGEYVVFSRAKAFDPFVVGQGRPQAPNDPNEPQIQYDLVRLPFNEGKGGTPVPVEGASANGMSNTYPKISPDGKWIVFTQCRNGLLIRPDSRLWIIPTEGGKAREMTCNTRLMNSWHSFSPNGRWLVFSSKSRTPYTQAFLTHIDEDGNDTPAILVPNCTAANRAVNIPEFMNAPYEALDTIRVPVVDHHVHTMTAERQFKAGDDVAAIVSLTKALENEPTFVRALVNLGAALMRLGRHEEALPYLERALTESPGDLYALNNLTLACLETGRAYLALRYADRLLRLAPAYPGVSGLRARAHRAAGALDAELKNVEKAVALSPKDAMAARHMADLYRRAGRLEDSMKYLGKAADLSPNDPGTIASMAWLLATNPDDGIRDGKRAVELAKRAVTLTESKVPQPLDILAAALAETGDFKAAVEAEKQALALAKKAAPRLVPALERRLESLVKGRPIRVASDR